MTHTKKRNEWKRGWGWGVEHFLGIFLGGGDREGPGTGGDLQGLFPDFTEHHLSVITISREIHIRILKSKDPILC